MASETEEYKCDFCHLVVATTILKDARSGDLHMCSECFKELECQGCFQPLDTLLGGLKTAFRKKFSADSGEDIECVLCTSCKDPFHAVCLAPTNPKNQTRCLDCTTHEE
jgi:hypothetical protein